MKLFWENKRVLVAGGGGFAGSHLVEKLVSAKSRVTVIARNMALARRNLASCVNKINLIEDDLSELSICQRAVRSQDIVFNLAGVVGGIDFNVTHHGSLFFTNSMVNLHLLEAARQENVELFQCTSSTCVYSRLNSAGALETKGFEDEPEPTVLGYGWSKRMAELQAMLYAKEFGMKISIVRPSNMYGPRDDFSDDTSHVIPALIKRTVGRTGTVTIWGSGKQTRSFIFVTDAVDAMLQLIEHHPVASPVNIGTDEEVSISSLAEMIARISKSPVDFKYDTSRPEGQARKFPNTEKVRSIIDWRPKVGLEEGLSKTIEWYLHNLASIHGT